MANIDVGGAGGRRKSVDTNIPLVPFIDLLLCCVMFLLVTAVWNEMASLPANAAAEGGSADALAPETLKLAVLIQQDGYVITTGAGDRVPLPRQANALDIAGLATRLTTLRSTASHDAITLIPDDGIPMQAVTDTMDAVRSTGFKSITLSGAQ